MRLPRVTRIDESSNPAMNRTPNSGASLPVLDAGYRERWGTSGFESVYLELARRLNFPIAGKDKPLLAAGAANAGIRVFAP